MWHNSECASWIKSRSIQYTDDTLQATEVGATSEAPASKGFFDFLKPKVRILHVLCRSYWYHANFETAETHTYCYALVTFLS